LNKTIKPTLIVISVVAIILTIASQQQSVAFAMHDSTLGVNTWIASDNSTQLHTIDLNKGPVSSTSTAEGGGTIEEEGEITEEQEEDVDAGVEEEEEEEDEEPSPNEGEEEEEEEDEED
jgi:hypothetical protein